MDLVRFTPVLLRRNRGRLLVSKGIVVYVLVRWFLRLNRSLFLFHLGVGVGSDRHGLR